MSNRWLLTFLGIAVVIFSLGAFMQYSGDHKECVQINESGFSCLAAVMVWGMICGWFRE